MTHSMMTKGRILGLAVLGLLVAAPLAGQRGPRQGPPGVRGGGLQVEALLSMRERLELNSDQVDQLNGIRSELLAERATQVTESMKIRSDAAAGEITREEVREHMQAVRENRVQNRDAVKEQIDSILTLEQREQLLDLRERRVRGREARGRGRSEARGRRGGRRGPRG